MLGGRANVASVDYRRDFGEQMRWRHALADVAAVRDLVASKHRRSMDELSEGASAHHDELLAKASKQS